MIVSPRGTASGFAPESTLIPGMIPALGEQLRERRAVTARLADRLVEEDHAADVLLDPRRREEQVAVRAPRLLGRLDADRRRSACSMVPVALVGGEDALAPGDERPRGFLQLLRHEGTLPAARLFDTCAAWRCSPAGATATATTLYSGQLVSTSADCPTSRFVRTSGKWNAVKTWPGSIRLGHVGRIRIEPLRAAHLDELAVARSRARPRRRGGARAGRAGSSSRFAGAAGHRADVVVLEPPAGDEDQRVLVARLGARRLVRQRREAARGRPAARSARSKQDRRVGAVRRDRPLQAAAADPLVRDARRSAASARRSRPSRPRGPSYGQLVAEPRARRA